MSKRNMRRFWQSQRAHLKAMLNEEHISVDEPDLGVRDYHLEVYRSQKYLGRILSAEKRDEIWHREVLPF